MTVTLELEITERGRFAVMLKDGAEVGRLSFEEFARSRPAKQLEAEWIAGTFKETFPTDLPAIPARRTGA